MAQLKNLIVNGASRFLTPIKGDLSGTSDYSLKMKTYKQGSSTETYGTAYPLWAQWETNTVLKLLCTGYSTKVDIANSAGDADTVDGHHFHWSGQSGQPTWVWGGNDSTNMYVYNPLNFSVEKSRVVQGNYTTNGGQQNPNYFGVNKVGFLMMNTPVNGNSQYKDWIIMDCYNGSDVGGGVALGVNRQSLGAYIMRSPAERTSWTESAELLHTSNYNNYAPTKTGGGASGTWGINITGASNLLNINGMAASTNYGTTAGIIQDTTNGPESGSWHNTLRVLHNNSQGYYTSIAVNFTGTDGMWFGSNRAGTKTWHRVFADNYLDVSKATTGTLAVARGGTGATTFTSTAALVGNGTSAISASNLKISNYEATLVSSGTDATRYVATNSYGSVSLWASENRGVYDHTNSKWIIASKQDSSKTYVPRWASIGGAAKPVYFDSDGSAAACSSTVGSTDIPVYMNAGTITTTGKKFSDYVTLATAQTISGAKTFSSNITINTASARVKFTHSTSNNTGFVGISTDGANLGLYDSINSKYVIYTNYSDTYIPRWASIGNSTTPVYFNSSGKATVCSRSIPRVYLASECTSYTSDDNVSTCTPAAVKKAVTLFGDDRYVRLSTDQTISDNKTFSAATYFDSGVYPSTAGEGNVGTLARPWEYISGKYVRACDGTNENYYCYMRPYTVGTTSTIGNGRLTLGNSIAEGTAGNARGSLVIYSGGTQYCIITGYAGYISFTFG